MYIPKNNKEEILIDGKNYTVEQLVYAVRVHERQKEKIRESMRMSRQKKREQKDTQKQK